MSQEPPRDRDPVPRFLGRVLLVVGVLWMASAGICTVWVMVAAGNDPGSNNAGWVTLIVIIGLVTMAAGFGVFMLGRALARN